MIKEINELSKHFGFSFKDRHKFVDAKPADENQTDLFTAFLKANNG